MDWSEYFRLYDSLEENENKMEIEKPVCLHDYIMDRVLVCCKCGEINSDILYSEIIESKNKKNLHVYHRKSYFLTRLYLMNRTMQCNREEYNRILEILKEEEFESIKQLRIIMKWLKFSRYYKYIYSIFYDLKGINLFQFDVDKINSMTQTFLQIKRNFKKRYPQKKNLFNYHLLIYYVFQIHEIDCDYDSVIFPQNKQRLSHFIGNLL